MTDSEIDYEVIPANSSCSNTINTITIQPLPGSVNSSTNQDIDDFHAQHAASSQYDNVGDMNIQPLHGGTKTYFKRNFKIIEINNVKNNKINKIISIKEYQSPINAAKILSKLINNKKNNFTIKIKEITKKSKKNEYGPYKYESKSDNIHLIKK